MTEAEITAFGHFVMGILRRIERTRQSDPDLLAEIDVTETVVQAIMASLSNPTIRKVLDDVVKEDLPEIIDGDDQP